MTTDNGMSDEDKILYEYTKGVKYEKEDQQYDGAPTHLLAVRRGDDDS